MRLAAVAFLLCIPSVFANSPMSETQKIEAVQDQLLQLVMKQFPDFSELYEAANVMYGNIAENTMVPKETADLLKSILGEMEVLRNNFRSQDARTVTSLEALKDRLINMQQYETKLKDVDFIRDDRNVLHKIVLLMPHIHQLILYLNDLREKDPGMFDRLNLDKFFTVEDLINWIIAKTNNINNENINKFRDDLKREHISNIIGEQIQKIRIIANKYNKKMSKLASQDDSLKVYFITNKQITDLIDNLIRKHFNSLNSSVKDMDFENFVRSVAKNLGVNVAPERMNEFTSDLVAILKYWVQIQSMKKNTDEATLHHSPDKREQTPVR